MSVRSSYKDFYERVGSGAATALDKVADIAADVVCGLYSGYAGFMRGLDGGSANGLGADSLFESMCNPRPNFQPPPPPEEPGIPGGKCPVPYTVTACYVENGTQKGVNVTTKYGPLGPYYRFGGAGGTSTLGFYSRSSDGTQLLRNDQFNGGNQQITQNGIAARILSAVRQDGQPDNCGSIAPSYQPRIPPSGDLAPIRPVPFPGGPINLPITVIPVLFRPEISFSPQINVDVGGIKVGFDLGGVTINLPPAGPEYPSLPPGGDPRPSPPTPDPASPSLSDEIGDLVDYLSDLEEKIDELKECACDEDRKRPVLQTVFSSATGGTLVLPARTIAARIAITSQPSNPKRESGNGGDDVFYAGWAWWKQDAGLTTRQPLDALSKTYFKPNERYPEQFVYTCRAGYTAGVVIFHLGEIPSGG